MATFNEFQRELRARGIDSKNAYIFTLVYERLAQCLQQQDEIAKAIILLTEQLQQFVNLRELDAKDMAQMKKRMGMVGRHPGIDVQSVANEPED